MHTIVSIETHPLFLNLPSEELKSYSRLWKERSLEPGEVLWQQGDSSRELALLMSGRLSVVTDGVEVATIRAGELIGEASIFVRDGKRNATLVARERSRISFLSENALSSLKSLKAALHPALVESALLTMIRRIRKTDSALVRRGDPELVNLPETSNSAWKSLKSWFSAKPQRPPAPELTRLLRRLPGLDKCPTSLLVDLKSAFRPRYVEVGEILFKEGDAGGTAYLLGSAELDLLRCAGHARAASLGRMKAGELVGINTLIEEGHRSASGKVARAGWVFEMSLERAKGLQEETQQAWQRTLLCALSQQLQNANYLFGEAHRRHQSSRDEGLNSQILEALKSARKPAGTSRLPRISESGIHQLNQIKVVLSDDQRRRSTPRL